MLACGGFEFLSELLERKVLSPNVFQIESKDPCYRFDRLLMKLICNRCKFKEKDCDYRGLVQNALPCGGYILLSLLLEKGILDEDKIQDSGPKTQENI